MSPTDYRSMIDFLVSHHFAKMADSRLSIQY